MSRAETIKASGVKLKRYVTPKREKCKHCNGTGYTVVDIHWEAISIGTFSFRLCPVGMSEFGKENVCSICGGQSLHAKWTDFEQETNFLCVNCLNVLSIMEGEEREALRHV